MTGRYFKAAFNVNVEATLAFVVMGTDSAGKESEFFNTPRRVAVPGLAARALPEVLQRFKATGGATIAAQRFGGLLQGALHLGLLGGIELLAGQPLGGDNQRRVLQQMLGIKFSALVFTHAALHFDDGVQHV